MGLTALHFYINQWRSQAKVVSRDLGQHLTGSLLHLQMLGLMWRSSWMEILGGTANIPQQFGIEFSMKPKPKCLPFNKITLLLQKSLPLLFSTNDTTNFSVKDESICKYLDGTQRIWTWRNSIR